MGRLTPLFLIPMLAACTMGPNYAGPPSTELAGGSASFVRGGPTVQANAPSLEIWWPSLNDATLNQLEQRALAANPSIAVAQARLRQSRATLRLDRANQSPSAGAMAVLAHAELPRVELGAPGPGSAANGNTLAEIGSIDFFNLGFDASWEVDLFGGRRRAVEASLAIVGVAEANLADAQVQLTADVAQTYVSLRDRQAQLMLARRSAEMQRQMVSLTRQRFERGASSLLDVERLQTQLNVSEAQILPIEAEIEVLKNGLAVLVGEQPGSLDRLLDAPAAVPLVPEVIRIEDPAALLQRRPDIRAAERRLASQTARVGIAEASRFPRLSLFGLIGLGGTSLSALTDLANLSTIAMPQLQWQFLDFGRATARVEQAQGARDETDAQYRLAVLAALKDAEDALSRFGHRRRSLILLVQVKASADRAATLMQQRFRSGTATLIDALDVERQRVSAEQDLASAAAALTSDYVALQKALGLGWARQ
jgi:NodT family efflux transporter outer membrane factor (OMF) lipoprotein